MKKIISFVLTCILLVNCFAFTAFLTETEENPGFFPGWDTRYRLEKDLPSVPLTFTAEVQFPVEYNYAATSTDADTGATIRIPGVGGSLFGNYTGSSGTSVFSVNRGYPRFEWNDDYENIQKSDNRTMIFEFNEITTGETVSYQGTDYDVTPMYTGKAVVVTITVDHTNKQVSCYLDGVLKQTIKYAEAKIYDMSGNATTVDVSLVKGPTHFTKNNYVIAGDNRSLNSNYLRGLADNQVSLNKIALFSTVRTATQVAADYTSIANDETPSAASVYFDFAGYPDRPVSISDVTGEYVAPRKIRYLSQKSDLDGQDYAYSMAFVGDTQKITRYSANIDGNNSAKVNNLQYIYDWLLANKEAEKIEYVIGLGDITDTSAQAEWDIAVKQINRLSEKYGTNYIAIQGNHDRRGTYTSAKYDYNYDPSIHVAYDDAFAGTAYAASVTERYKSNSILNFYKKVNLNGVPYMFLCLEYAAPTEVLEWANEVVSDNPNYNVIYITHGYLSKQGTPLDWSSGTTPDATDDNTDDGNDWGDNDTINNGLEQWHRFVKKHKNICMVVSGHIGNDEIMVTDNIGDNENVVKQVLIDHQDIDGKLIDGDYTDNPKGLGVVALMYFMGDGKTVMTDAISTVRAYSEDYASKPYFDENNRFSFELELNGTKGGDFSSSTAGVPDGWCTVADVLYVIDEVLNNKGYECDVNADGKVSLADVIRVVSYINK